MQPNYRLYVLNSLLLGSLDFNQIRDAGKSLPYKISHKVITFLKI
jgi:hypothetical protein